MKKKRRTKRDGQKIHAKKRALQRYGIDVNSKLLHELIKQIQSGKSNYLERKTHRISIHLVHYEGKSFKVAYDKTRQNICSFLPKE